MTAHPDATAEAASKHIAVGGAAQMDTGEELKSEAAPMDEGAAADSAMCGAGTRSADLQTLEAAQAAVATGAPAASHACVQRLAQRLHAAALGWGRVFAGAAADGALSGSASRSAQRGRGAGGWMRVKLKVVGKGACESGAAVCMCECSVCSGPGSADLAGGVRDAGRCGCADVAQGRVVGFVTTAVSPRMAGWVGGQAVLSEDAVGAQREGVVDGGGAVPWQARLYVVNPYAASCRRSVVMF